MAVKENVDYILEFPYIEDELDWDFVRCKGYHYVHLVVGGVRLQACLFLPRPRTAGYAGWRAAISV